ASTPPGKNRKVLPMCPVQIVTYVSGRSILTISRVVISVADTFRGLAPAASVHNKLLSPAESAMELAS
ncbi:hypothetical protein NKJ72_30755, partial [Mesorhizobium sp. M0045]|uniref:hypothetical protein n=1 Tax=Mesorhizobium sp. M0045 TaxID=2956857 RepID=UPI00333DCBE0